MTAHPSNLPRESGMARTHWILAGRVGHTSDAAVGGIPPRGGWQVAWADPQGRALTLLCEGHTDAAAALMQRLAETGDVDAMERLAAWNLWGPRLLGPGPWRRSVGLAWLERAALARSR
jgi:hypothetical protein